MRQIASESIPILALSQCVKIDAPAPVDLIPAPVDLIPAPVDLIPAPVDLMFDGNFNLHRSPIFFLVGENSGECHYGNLARLVYFVGRVSLRSTRQARSVSGVATLYPTYKTKTYDNWKISSVG
ncbi:MAG: hypothetical protein OXM61_23500, partial [Candidatus Poribacteria bacterium]|nr:hypothetical protein [Candidatus Poribacteria bacterium]